MIENTDILMKYELPMILLSPKALEWYPFYKKTSQAMTDFTVAASKLVTKAIDNLNINDDSDDSVLGGSTSHKVSPQQVQAIMLLSRYFMVMHAKNKKNTSVFDQNLLLKLNPEDTIVYEIKDSKYIYTKHKM